VFPCPDGGKCAVLFPQLAGISNPQPAGASQLWHALSDFDSEDAVLIFDVTYQRDARPTDEEFRK